MKTADDLFRWIEQFTNLEKQPKGLTREYRLDRMKLILDYLEHPQNSYKSIHIAGSKGKGSVAAFISSILVSAGMSVGTYTSPHVSTYKERITINNQLLDDESFVKHTETLEALVRHLSSLDVPGGEKPTTYELLTALAFLIYKDHNIDILVAETGLGGRLDATNVLSPVISVITPIELEHTDILGDTLEKIASEKAGIIKDQTAVFISKQPNEALQVFRNFAASKKAQLYEFEETISGFAYSFTDKAMFTEFTVAGFPVQARIPLLGVIQAENAALASAVTLKLLGSNTKTVEHIIKGLETVKIKARNEFIEGSPSFIFDVAHTRNSISSLLHTIQAIPLQRPYTLIFGAVEGKDYKTMLDILVQHFDNVIISKPNAFKPSSPEMVFNYAKELKHDSILALDPQNALDKAKELTPDGLVVCTGSFFMVSEIRPKVLTHDIF